MLFFPPVVKIVKFSDDARFERLPYRRGTESSDSFIRLTACELWPFLPMRQKQRSGTQRVGKNCSIWTKLIIGGSARLGVRPGGWMGCMVQRLGRLAAIINTF